MELLNQFEHFYKQLDQSSLADLPNLYSQDIRFIDPVTQHEGMAALTDYFKRLLQGCESCNFEIHSKEASNGRGFVEWTMSLTHPKLKRGATVLVQGVSVINYSGNKIVLQRDYYDMGEMIYENIPLLGRLIMWLRTRLAH